VSHQRAIEDIYWRHRIWPKERPDTKPSLDEVMTQAQLEKKVTDYVRNSQALEDYWHRPITAEQLQAEMDRMAKHTKQPEVLRELFAALGNDPFIIAECLARPTLVERSLVNWHRIIHGEPIQSAEADLRAHPMVVAWNIDPVGSLAAGNKLPRATAAQSGNYTLPGIPDTAGCINNTWTATSILNAPAGRFGHTAVWTGTEMIVWGGGTGNRGFNNGGRYNPSTDSWRSMSTAGAPIAGGAAVWTGTEMIVWGASAGGRYNPVTNTWTATSTTNAPTYRNAHTAVWTGTEMIVWGGVDAFGFALNTGGKYNPSTNSWTAITTTNAPTARTMHTAAWTGSEMIIWGGWDGLSTILSTGRRI
jgi:hypothetical protein